MAKVPKYQLTPGRPKTAVDKANLPVKAKTPDKPKLPSGSELPKEVIGSHGPSLHVEKTTVGGTPGLVGKPSPKSPRPKRMPI